jgi:hypothetical protein
MELSEQSADIFTLIEVKQVDKIEAARVILDPEIYDRISSDHSPPREDFDLPDIDYLAGYVDGQLASIYVDEPFRDGEKIHFQVLKPYRWAARVLFNMSLPEGNLYCLIPECFMTTINFVKNMGFELIEIKPKVYLKYGKLQDRYLLRLPCHL